MQDQSELGHRSFDYVRETPCSVGYYIVSTNRQFNVGYQTRMGEDCGKWLISELRGLETKAMAVFYDEKRLQCEDRLAYHINEEIQCHICHRPFNTNHSDKVLDLEHVTGQYRGAAHMWCYRRIRRTCEIPVFFITCGGTNPT